MENQQSEDRTVEVFGHTEMVPEWVKNLGAYGEYREEQSKLLADEGRLVRAPSGKVLALPSPNFVKIFVKNGFNEEEIKQYAEVNKKYASLQNQITRLKRKAASDDGKHACYIYKDLVKKYDSLLLEYLSAWNSPAETHKKLIEQGIPLRYHDVLNFSRQNVEKIRELRNKVSEEYEDLSIGVKRSRLEKLNYLLNDLMQQYDKQGVSNKIPLAREIRGTLEQARKEVEGDELKLTVNGRIDVEATITTYIQGHSLIQNLTIIQMAASRVAQRLGVPYGKIVDRLANSFYKKHNGFRRTSTMRDNPEYPSAINYDILELQEVNAENVKAEEAKVYEVPLEEEKKDVAKLLREALEARLKLSQQDKS
jgi:transposase